MKYLSILLLMATLSIMQACSNSDAAVPKVTTSSFVNPTTGKRMYNKAILPHLEKIVNILEGGVAGYDWSDPSSCNMGLLAQSITNSTGKEIAEALREYETPAFNTQTDNSGKWTDKAVYYCGITNKPVEGIIGELQKAGFTSIDIQNIEYCSDPYVLSFIGRKLEYNNPSDYLWYMKTWRDIVRKQ